MKAKTKRVLAAVLAAVMILPGMPYGDGVLVASASNVGDSLETDKEVPEEEKVSEDENAGNEEKPDVGNGEVTDTPDDGDAGTVEAPDASTGAGDEAPGAGDAGAKEDEDAGETQTPGGAEEGETPDAGEIPGGGQNPEDSEPPAEGDAEGECQHISLSYVSCQDGTHEVICKACSTVLRTEDCTYEETVSGNTTETVSTCTYCGYILEEEAEQEETVPALKVTPRASEHKRIAYFSFDDETDGFKGAGASAAKNGTLTFDGWRGKALQLSGSQYLNVTKEDGTSLLTGLEGITVSYYSKCEADGHSGWSFYAAPSTNPPGSNNENYLGILDKKDSVNVESYIGSRSNPTSASLSAGGLANEWRHVVVTYNDKGVSLYIDGKLKQTKTKGSASSIATMLGESSIIQIGKAQWGGGEYYHGLIDEFSIYDYVMTETEVGELYESSFEDDVTVSDPKMLAHYTFSDIKTTNSINGTAVPADAKVPNTSADTQGENYDAEVINSGAELYEDGSSLLLPGGAPSANPAYVKLPSGMFLDESGRMRDVLTVNIWMKNISESGNWTGFYVGTDPAENTGGVMPLNYLLLNPRKDDKFKATLTRNDKATGAPYGGEQTLTEGQTTGAWQMYTVVVGPNVMTTYLDGQQVGRRMHSMKMSEWTADGTDAVPDILASIGAGGYVDDGRWNGAVKECSIYNYQLTAEQIDQLYQDGQEKEEVADPMMLAHYTFGDIASYEGNASLVDKGKVSDGAIVPNTSAATKDKSYNAVVHGSGASLRAGGIGLELPGGEASKDSAYVELPSEMFTDSDGRMRNTLSVNLWMQNISGQGDWTGFYVGTDAAKNTANTGRPLNYLLVNPRKNDQFKVAMTYNQTMTAEPYNKENLNQNGVTDDWWQMYTIVVNGTDLTTYLDGKKLGTVKHSMKMSEWTADGTAEVPAILSYIGKGGYVSDRRWQGAVKECSIYNYELTQDEITRLYDDVHAPEESAAALVTATSVSTDFLGADSSASIYYGDSYELPAKTSVTLSDGSTNAAYVTWYDEKGERVTDTSVLEPGTYNLTGKVENYFPAPFIEERADPQVYYDEPGGKYYFTSSWPAYGSKEKGYDKIVIRQADSLLGLADAEEHIIWTAPGDKYKGRYHIWAPELHHIGSKWYCYFAGTLSGDWDIRPRILVCEDSKDITKAENWTEHERFMNKDGTDKGVSDLFSLDMTYFENKGKHYVIWAYKPVGSELLMGEVSGDDPTKLIGEPMVLTYPEYAWECDGNQNVDEGPAVLKANGRIYVAFSAAATGDMYCMGMISADENADLMDITNWTKSPTPALQSKDLQGQYGPGHNSFTVDEDGKAVLVYHARDEECHNNTCGYSGGDPLYDPCRNAMLAYVRYAADGTPVFNSTADKELAGLDTSSLKYTLTVESMTEAEPAASYGLVTDAKDAVSNTHEGTLHGSDAAFDGGLVVSGAENANLVNYLDISDNTDLLTGIEAAKGLTITAWVKNDNQTKDEDGLPNNNNRPTVFSIGHDENNFFAFTTGNWGAARASFYVDGKEVGDDGETRIQYNTPGMEKSVVGDWYPVAITLTDRSSGGKSQTTVRYYMNDELLCKVNTPAALRDLGGLAQFYIGGGVSAGNYHDMYGGIRNVKIYDRALPADLLAKYDKEYLVDNLALMLGADLTTHAIRTGVSLPLPKTGHPGVTYTWQTSDASVMDENGNVTSSKEEKKVTLTATIKTTLDSSYEETVTFPVTVLDTYAFWLEEVYKKLSIRNLDDVRGSLYLPMSDKRYPEVQISWKSDHADIISDVEKNGIAPGLVTRPAADTDVKLTAVLSVGEGDERQEKTKEFTAKVKKKAQEGELTDYMFAYFIGEGTKTGEQMYFADSRDGLHWTALNDGEPVITSSMGEKGLRDPFIMRSHEGDKFYLIATDLWIAGGTSWGDSQTKGSKSIMVWESTDLVNWSDQRMCKVAIDEAGCTWAPEAFWDEETQDYAVFWASKTSLDGYGPHHIWKCHTRDFYTYTEPEIWITLKNASGNDISVIDTTVIKVGDTYYRFNKNEDNGNAVMTNGDSIGTKFVYMEKSSSLDGSWEYVPSSYLLDPSNQYREGATSFRFNDDDVETPTWCLLLDNFGGGGYYPATTTDLASGNFTKLGASEYSFPTEGILRHGSVLNITAEEYAAIEKKWGPFVEEEETPTTTLEEARIASFTFDDEESGFRGSGAVAEKKGGPVLSEEVREGASGKSAKFGSGSWLDVKTKGGHSLLTGVESMSISYYSKTEDPNKDGAGWAFFAAPNTDAPEYNKSENYLGILDHVGEVKAERYHGTRGSATSASTIASSLENTWRHVVVSYTPKGIRIYIDGTLKATVSKRRLSALSDLLGDSSILQLGKGNWGGGEYFNGYMDDVTIYNRALTQEEVTAIYEGKVPMPDPGPYVPTYTVTFNPDRGVLAGASFVEVDEGEKVPRPTDPTRRGYTFLGWSREQNGTVYWNFETDTVSEDMTLYACWKSGTEDPVPGETTYTITFDPDGGVLSGAASVTVKQGEKIPKPADPVREGYIFLGWSQVKDGTEYWDFENGTAAAQMTLYACWKSDTSTETTYTVIFDPNGGALSEAASVTVKQGEKIPRPTDPVREGYIFLGWSQVKDGTEYWDFENGTAAAQMILYACWKSGTGPEDPGEEEWGDILPEDRPASVEAVPKGLWIAGVEEQGYTYTGKAISPAVRVYNHKTRLTLKTDYTIAYKNNVKASDASDAKTAPAITVTGKGNYTGKDIAFFKIQPKDIADEDVSIWNIAVAYKKNGVQKPVPVVKWNGKKLANNRDFTVEYPDSDKNELVGEETVTRKAYSDSGDWRIVVTGTGNFAGTREITLTIAGQNAKLTDKLSVKKVPNQTYDEGKPLMPELEVKDGRTLLTAGVHYDVAYENNKEIGTATVIITGKSSAARAENGADAESAFSYVGEKRVTFQIVGENISKAKVAEGLEKSYVYTGREIKPAPKLTASVKKNGATVLAELEPDKDYTVKYSNNTKVGTATIFFTGKGAYTGTLKKTFKITAYDIGTDGSERLQIEELGEVPYAKGGSKPKPVVTYKIGGDRVTLTEGVDYTLSYKNNSKLNDCGEGSDQNKWPTVTVKGKGNYKGAKTATYKIVPQDIGKLEIQVADKVYQNKPGRYQSVPKVIDLNGKALAKGTDYEKTFSYAYAEDVTFEDGTQRKMDDPIESTDILPAGTKVKVTVAAKGTNYKEEISGIYRITAKSITGASVTVKPQVYTGYEVKPGKDQITKIKVGRDNLQEGDYEIIGYTNNIKKGTAKMTIRGVGDYGGTKTVSFKIAPRNVVWWAPEEKGKMYDILQNLLQFN